MQEETPDPSREGDPQFRELLDHLVRVQETDGTEATSVPCADCGEQHGEAESLPVAMTPEELLGVIRELAGSETASDFHLAIQQNAAHQEAMRAAAERMRAAAEVANLALDPADRLRWVLVRASCNCLLPMVMRPDGAWAVTRDELAEVICAEQAQEIARDLGAAQLALAELATVLAENGR